MLDLKLHILLTCVFCEIGDAFLWFWEVGGGGCLGWGEEQKMCVGFQSTHFKASYIFVAKTKKSLWILTRIQIQQNNIVFQGGVGMGGCSQGGVGG